MLIVITRTRTTHRNCDQGVVGNAINYRDVIDFGNFLGVSFQKITNRDGRGVGVSGPKGEIRIARFLRGRVAAYIPQSSRRVVVIAVELGVVDVGLLGAKEVKEREEENRDSRRVAAGVFHCCHCFVLLFVSPFSIFSLAFYNLDQHQFYL